MIQMQPLKFEIADDVEEKHAYDTGRPGTSQSYIHNLNDLGPPSSISHLEPRRSGYKIHLMFDLFFQEVCY
jgi:hypothetical protein